MRSSFDLGICETSSYPSSGHTQANSRTNIQDTCKVASKVKNKKTTTKSMSSRNVTDKIRDLAARPLLLKQAWLFMGELLQMVETSWSIYEMTSYSATVHAEQDTIIQFESTNEKG